MKRFFDASVLVEACLVQSPKFSVADTLLKTAVAVTSAHALAEAYATLSGDARLKIKAHDAAQMVGDLAEALQVQALSAKAHRGMIRDLPTRGVSGGSIFDAIHAAAARESKCVEIHTLNVRHFKHVAPDLTVTGL